MCHSHLFVRSLARGSSELGLYQLILRVCSCRQLQRGATSLGGPRATGRAGDSGTCPCPWHRAATRAALRSLPTQTPLVLPVPVKFRGKCPQGFQGLGCAFCLPGKAAFAQLRPAAPSPALLGEKREKIKVLGCSGGRDPSHLPDPPGGGGVTARRSQAMDGSWMVPLASPRAWEEPGRESCELALAGRC